MASAVARLFLCLSVGECLFRIDLLPFPAAVIGLLLFFLSLCVTGLSPSINMLADNILAFLGMLFVPAGVGVLTYADVLKAELVPVLASVIGGAMVTLGVTAAVANRIAMSVHHRTDNAMEVPDAAA